MKKEDLVKLKKETYNALTCNRHSLLLMYPFIGNILMRMELCPIRDMRVRTACTDGKTVYFDVDFYDRLKDSERIFVLAHEVWHCVLMHLIRCQTRNSELFNIASDMEVNYLLDNQETAIKITPPEGLLFPPKEMAGKSAEVIYEWLLKQQKNKKSNSNSPSKQGSNKDNNSSSKKDGNKTGKLEGQFDKHEYTKNADSSKDNSNNDGGNGGGKVVDQWGEVGYDEDFKPHISDQFAEEMREAIIAEVQRAQRTQGNIPAGIEGILKEITKPEINWKEVLAQFVTSCYNDKRRWLPPSRRHIYNGVYLQSRRGEKINIAVAIDTSGSCIGDLPKFFGELKHLVESFGNYSIHLFQSDAAVDSYKQYDEMNPLNINENIKWTGGGGTSFCPPFEYIQKHGINIDCLIYLTDGYGDAPKNAPKYPVMWLLTKDGSNDFCEWGRKIKFKNSPY